MAKLVKEIRFRLLPQEKNTLMALAETQGMSQSAFVRQLIAQAAKGKKKKALNQEAPE